MLIREFLYDRFVSNIDRLQDNLDLMYVREESPDASLQLGWLFCPHDGNDEEVIATYNKTQ